MIKLLCGICLCAVLAACGGSSDPAPVMQPTQPPVALDVGSQVEAQLAQAEASSETSEPAAIDTVTVPTPDDTEPKPL